MSFIGQFQMSIERLNNDIGYIKTNVVLCILELNTALQWSLDKIKEMLEILDKNIKENYIDFEKKTTKDMSNTPYNKNEYYDTPRCKMKRLATSSKTRANKKKWEHTIDFDFLVEIYNKQKGKNFKT